MSQQILPWKCEIEKVDNGYVFSTIEQTEDDLNSTSSSISSSTKIKVKEVFEDTDDNNKSLIALLYRVAEHFGYIYNKYGENNIEIKDNVKGRKLD